jgi:hypothetical protein
MQLNKERCDMLETQCGKKKKEIQMCSPKMDAPIKNI